MKKYYIKPYFLSAVIFILFFASACNKGDTDDNIPVLRPLTQVEKDIVYATNSFSLELFDRVNADYPEDNVFMSPFSVTSALAMTLNGANGETKDAIRDALKLTDLTDEEINQSYKDLVDFLFSLDKTVTMEIANSNWYRQELSAKEQFVQILMEYYNAEVRAADFGDPATVGQINQWISDKTHGKIENMLDRISEDAVMYLINAIYFKADWAFQFDKNKTEDLPFYLTDGSEVMTSMMYSQGVKMGQYQNDNFMLLDIPYGNGQFNFTIVTTADGGESAFSDLNDNFSMDMLVSMLGDTVQRTSGLYLPKFKIEFKETLNQSLTDMGMVVAFDPARADFSNLFDQNLQLSISHVVHQSFLEVNEEGSEAAAATIVGVITTSLGPSDVRIDRPFIFMIREKHSNIILFIGQYLQPDAQ